MPRFAAIRRCPLRQTQRSTLHGNLGRLLAMVRAPDATPTSIGGLSAPACLGDRHHGGEGDEDREEHERRHAIDQAGPEVNPA
jgi:hypothetical protein